MKITNSNYYKLIVYILKKEPRYSIFSFLVVITDMISTLGRLGLISCFISILVNRQDIFIRQIIAFSLVILLFEFVRVLIRQLYVIEGKKIDDSFLNGTIENVLKNDPHAIIIENIDDKLNQYKFNLTYIGGVSNNFQHFVNLMFFLFNLFVYLAGFGCLLYKLWSVQIFFVSIIILVFGIAIIFARDSSHKEELFEKQKRLFEQILGIEKKRNYFIYNIVNNYPVYNVIKTFSSEDFFSKKYFFLNEKGLEDSIEHKHNNDRKARSFYKLQISLFILIYILLILNIVINLNLIVVIPIYIGIATQFVTSSTQAFQSLESINRIEPYISTIIDFIEPSVNNQVKADIHEISSIEFKNVSFKYEGTRNNIIKNVNLKIEDMTTFSKIALVGENGSGKSTFIKLLLGIYRPTEGSVLINGKDVASLSFDSMIKKIGVLSQEFSFFTGTIEENLAVNKDIQIEKFKYFLDNISSEEKLTNRLDNQIESLSEDNLNLSGGEKQRIALARILLDSKKDFFILDEPTSAFDRKSEKNFFQNLRKLVSNKTVLVVTHNLSEIKDFDRFLFVKKDGSIIDSSVSNIYDVEEFNFLLNKDILNRKLIN